MMNSGMSSIGFSPRNKGSASTFRSKSTQSNIYITGEHDSVPPRIRPLMRLAPIHTFFPLTNHPKEAHKHIDKTTRSNGFEHSQQ